MNIIRLLLVLGIAGGGYNYWKQHHEPPAPQPLGPVVSKSGFTALPPVEGQSQRKVIVVAAEDCPHEEAQHADRLAEALSRNGIPVERTHHVSFKLTGAPDSDTVDRMNKIMNGPLPIVFVNGRAKSNPSLADVVTEFEAGAR